MKRIFFYFITACLLLSFSSCQEKEPVDELSKSKIDFFAHFDDFENGLDKQAASSRASVINTGNCSEFWMTSFVSGRPNYMENVKYSKHGNAWSTENGTYFWPAKDCLNFYAISHLQPGKTGVITTNKDKQALENFSPYDNISGQKDFVYAYEFSGATGSNATYPTSIGLNFHHALSAISISAKNSNTAYTVEVTGMKIGNVISKGNFTFPSLGGATARWTLGTDKSTYTTEWTAPTTLTTSATQLGGSGATFMLIPQQLASQTKASTGACIALKVKITSSNGNKFYDGWVYVGINTNWEMGKKYAYTLDFTNGAGQDANGNTISLQTSEGIFNANCIIVDYASSKKFYGIDVTRANTFWSNSTVGDASNIISDNTEWTADVIWQDIPSRAINFCDASGKEITGNTYSGTGKSPLYIKAVGGKKGNVIVGIKKKGSSQYLWSWHLWLTEEPSLVAGFMDRNLGATSSKPSDGSKTYGLYYQFGRKDPFVGKTTIYDINGTTIGTGATIAKAQATFAQAVQTPSTFYASSYEWASSNNYTDNSWNDISGNKNKSFFDPCPQGWRLPTESEYSAFSTTTFPWDATNRGRTYNTNWFPASGYLSYSSGGLIGGNGYSWSATPNVQGGGFCLYFYGSGVYPSYNLYRTFGFPVRCVKE